MLARCYLSLLLLVSTTATKDHLISHGGPIKGRSYADHLRAHHISHNEDISHEGAELAFERERARHSGLATPYIGDQAPPAVCLIARAGMEP